MGIYIDQIYMSMSYFDLHDQKWDYSAIVFKDNCKCFVLENIARNDHINYQSIIENGNFGEYEIKNNVIRILILDKICSGEIDVGGFNLDFHEVWPYEFRRYDIQHTNGIEMNNSKNVVWASTWRIKFEIIRISS
jgi:hypothetical protein